MPNRRDRFGYMEKVIDFYYAIHYVVYRYYRRRQGEDRFMSLVYACGMHALLLLWLLLIIDGIISKMFHFAAFIGSGKVRIFVCFILLCILDYFVFFHKSRYVDVFDTYDEQIDSLGMRKKLKTAKIFNFCVLIIDLISFGVANYLNTH